MQLGDGFCPDCGTAVSPALPSTAKPPAREANAKPVLIVSGIVAAAIVLMLIFRTAGGGLGLVNNPATTVDRFFSALQADKLDEAMSQLDPDMRSQMSMMGPEKRDMAMREALRKASQKYCGGSSIASISTKTTEQETDRAKVVTMFHCNDGSNSSDDDNPTKMRKRDNKWYMTQ